MTNGGFDPNQGQNFGPQGQPQQPQFAAPGPDQQYGAPQQGYAQQGQPQQPQFAAPGPEQQYAQAGQPQPGQQYGAPQQGQQYGAPQQQGYPQPGQQYGAPQQGGYGQPGAQGYGAPQQPYPGAPAPQGPGGPGDIGIRIGARLLDGLILGIPLVVISLILNSAFGPYVADVMAASTIDAMYEAGKPSYAYYLLTAIINTAVVLGYFGYLESAMGQTLGKKIVGLRVVNAQGANPTFQQALTRNAWMGVSIIGLIPGTIGMTLVCLVGLGAAVAILVTVSSSPTKQGIHDKLAGGTQVIKV
ncbi:MAG: RDD family protein [Rhodococcus sp.]|nr:RDD family protein [Rhodococcus sp. (in: high G+C Gram-positive bacteria)]